MIEDGDVWEKVNEGGLIDRRWLWVECLEDAVGVSALLLSFILTGMRVLLTVFIGLEMFCGTE